MDFLTALSRPGTLILDGATGTELNRRGVDTGLPLWSANALLNDHDSQVLLQVHRDYLLAGADIITTDTFRTHRRALDPGGYAGQAFALTQRAVQLGRAAIAALPSPSPRYLAGSISTLEDCYRPDLVPPAAELSAEHAERVEHLARAGVDFILVETINTIREAHAAASQAVKTGLPVVVSFACDRAGRILSGETLTRAAETLLPLGVAALGVNCAPATDLEAPLQELGAICGASFPLIAYGNIGYADDQVGWINTDAVEPLAYCRHAATWQAKIIGGCCGTTPEHIRQLRLKLSPPHA